MLNRIFSGVGLLVGGGILVWLMIYVKNTVDLNAVLHEAKPFWIIAAILCIPAFEVIDGYIAWMVGRFSGQQVSFIGCLDSAVIGEFYYRLGPVGAPVQLKLMLDAGFTGNGAAAAYTWKLTANTVVYGLFAVTALTWKLLWYREDLGWAIIPTAVLIFGYVLICGCVFFVAARPEQAAALAERMISFLSRHVKLLKEHSRRERAVKKAEQFCKLFQEMRGNRPMLLRLFLGMSAEMFLVFSVPAFLYLGLGLTGVSFWNLLLTQCLVMVLSRIVILPGNAGGAEGSFFLFMSPIFGSAVSVGMVLWRLVTYVEVMVIGGVYSVIRFAWRTLKKK